MKVVLGQRLRKKDSQQSIGQEKMDNLKRDKKDLFGGAVESQAVSSK